MRVLTVHQPWAWAIAKGLKRDDIRTQNIRYRGPVLIHVGASSWSRRRVAEVLDELESRQMLPVRPDLDELEAQCGKIVARTEITGVREVAEGDADPWVTIAAEYGGFGWSLGEVEQLEPLPFVGRQGLTRFPEERVDELVPLGGHGLPTRAPFPYYGNKRGAAPLIERLMGNIVNLVIPFAGGLGELLGRSRPATIETVNDLDGLIVNVWRAIRYAPERVAELCDHPVHEATLHAAHDRLVAEADSLTDLMRSDPQVFDVELAAWWIWGRSAWLGGGWCSRVEAFGDAARMRMRVQGREGRPYQGQGVALPWRSRPQLSTRGQGVHSTHAKRPALAGQGARPHHGHGVTRRQLPVLRGGGGKGVGHGCGIHSSTHREALLQRFEALAARLRWVRVTCGDWRRVLTPAVTTSHGLTGVSLDPPYDHALRCGRLYRSDDPTLSADVRAWAAEHGDDPRLRVTLAGKDEEHAELEALGWTRHVWRNDGETIWASPGCCPASPQLSLDLGGEG